MTDRYAGQPNPGATIPAPPQLPGRHGWCACGRPAGWLVRPGLNHPEEPRCATCAPGVLDV